MSLAGFLRNKADRIAAEGARRRGADAFRMRRKEVGRYGLRSVFPNATGQVRQRQAAAFFRAAACRVKAYVPEKITFR